MSEAPLFQGLFQVAVVTADLDRAVATWVERYGVGPWELRDFDEARVRAEYRGETAFAPMRVAITMLQPQGMMIEVIQPLDDTGLYAESLRRHGGADHVHHLGVMTQDPDGARERYGALGLDKVLDGSFAGATQDVRLSAAYFDTQADLGFLTEIVHTPEGMTFSAPDDVRG